MFRRLDPERIVQTASLLRRRIDERFPDAGLGRVAAELESVAREAAALSAWMARPHWPVRIAVFSAIALLLGGVVAAVTQIQVPPGTSGISDLLQGLEALVNDIAFVGIAIYFLLGLEVRRKRARALDALHVLRSLAHIVDMHQLTKDPESLTPRRAATASSPKREMTNFELTRYLDYSSEMLTIVSKVAALYVQQFNDPVTVNAASDVEELSVGLSRAIWQKIAILDRVSLPEAAREAVEPVPAESANA
jgi:hypothetical protein